MEYLAIALIVTNLTWIGFFIFITHLHNKDTKDLRDRLMSRDFSEYKYYTKELPEIQRERQEELKEKKKAAKKEKPLTQEEREIKKTVEKF